MSRLMQLPMLFGVRGSIATQTMTNLTKEQKKEVDSIVREVIEDQSLAADKFEFIKQLSNTIGGDYRSDRTNGEAEFRVAIWRSTVYLLYHCDYSYSCTLCGETSYQTSTRTNKVFDRQYPVCPHCHKTLYGEKIVRLKKTSRGYMLLDDTGEQVTELFNKRPEIERIVCSPIKAIKGDRKVTDPQAILRDPEQRSKWYSVWIWEYFRQILNENIIRTHNRHEMDISGPANQLALKELLCELKRIGQKFYFDESTIDARDYEVLTSVYMTNAMFTGFLVQLVHKWKNYGVIITEHGFSIKITANGNIPFTSTKIVTEEPVSMLSIDSPASSNADEGSRSWQDIVESNIRKDGEETTELTQIIDRDWMVAVRGNLSSDLCRQVFDIYTQSGEIWVAFSDQYGQKEAAKSHISKFLSVSIKVIDDCRDEISAICQEFGIGMAKDQDETETFLESGDSVALVNDSQGHLLAHADCRCEDVMNVEEDFEDAKVIHVRHHYVRVDKTDKLIRMCPKCCM